MAFTLYEVPDSRSSTTFPPSEVRRYNADGEQDDRLVRQLVLQGTPPAIFRDDAMLYRGDVKLEPAGWRLYRATVDYGTRRLEVGKASWNFDTTGGTVRIKAAKEHIGSFPSADDENFPEGNNPYKGAIGASRKGDVDGAEIVIPALKVSYTYRHAFGVVDLAMAFRLSDATGYTNLNPWGGFEAGEALFMGASGEDGTETEAQITYHMVRSKNRNDLKIGDIINIAKKGHEYLWIEFEDEVEGGSPIIKPKRVHVERVYDAIDFRTVLGWE